MSTNLEYSERFQDAQAATINKLFWIAGSVENSDLRYLLEEIDEDEFKELFPALQNMDSDDGYGYETIVDALTEKGYYGLVAEVFIPQVRDFTYGPDGEPKSWGVHRGICSLGYVYAETTDELMVKIEELSEKMFAKCVAKDKANKTNKKVTK